MSKLIWNETGSRFFESGVDRGVFYTPARVGIPWNGLTSVKEAPSGGESVARYIDGRKYLAPKGDENFEATVEAFTFPPEIGTYLGENPRLGVPNQRRFECGLSYRTGLGNDESPAHGYKIHIVYNAIFTPGEVSYDSLSAGVNPINFSWDLTTRPESVIDVVGRTRIASHIVIDTRLSYSWAVEALEDILYGSDIADARLPTPDEVVGIFEDASILKITDNGDGTWTAEGPEEVIQMVNDDLFMIVWPSVNYINDTTYTIHSL